MEVQPTKSLWSKYSHWLFCPSGKANESGPDIFKIGNTKITANSGTARVIKEDDGSVKVIGGENVKVSSDEKGLKISLENSEISQFISLYGKSKILMDKCKFNGDDPVGKRYLGMFNASKKSNVTIGGENNEVVINGDLKGHFSCYTYGDNDEKRKDNVVINGTNYANINAGLHDNLTITGENKSKSGINRIDDKKVEADAMLAMTNSMNNQMQNDLFLQQQQQMMWQQQINQQMTRF